EPIRLRADIEPELVHRGGAARARDIADDHCRPPQNVFAEVALKDARLGVGIAAGRVVDEQRERLVLVELGGGGGCKYDRRHSKQTTCQHAKSSSLSAVVPAKAGTHTPCTLDSPVAMGPCLRGDDNLMGFDPTPQSSPATPPGRRICWPRSTPAGRAAPSGSRCRSS